MECPYCKHALTKDDVKKIVSKPEDGRKKTSAENGKKGGRPKKKPV